MGKKSIGAMPTPPKPPTPTDTTFAEECASLGMQEFDEEFNRRLREKLDALEEVRSDLSNEGIKVPGIVVCGAQSAGKSSVMEYLSDLNFPRAENTCTRCPTIVSLATDPQTTSPYALIGLEADKSKRTRLDDLSLFGTKIEELTDELTSKVGTGAGVITNVPIYVTVVRQKGPTLTLIDIPGITHLCTDGEQEDIHAVTKDLVESYIKDDAMVILVVIPATDDFGNAEALKLAKQYDPEGTRTLGVVTKIDLLTTDSYDSLVKRITMQGKNIHLQLGFIGLRCRTPAEVKAGITRAEAMIAEEKLRNSHPLLSQLDSTQFGLRALVSRIVDVQAERVDASFPEIKKLLVSRLEEAEADLARLKPACDDDTQRLHRMDEMVRTLDRDLSDAISGALDCSRDDTTLPLPATWCKLSLEFEGAIRKATPDFFSDEYKEKLQNQLKRVQGASLPNFMSSPVFVKSHTDIFFSKEFYTHKHNTQHQPMQHMPDFRAGSTPTDAGRWMAAPTPPMLQGPSMPIMQQWMPASSHNSMVPWNQFGHSQQWPMHPMLGGMQHMTPEMFQYYQQNFMHPSANGPRPNSSTQPPNNPTFHHPPYMPPQP